MSSRARIALLACSAVALLAAPATAGAAKPGYEVKPRQLSLTLHPPATDGYSAAVTTEGNFVTLTFVKDDGVASYRVKGRVTLRRLEADFGALGHISAQFVGGRRLGKRLTEGSCRGHDPIRLRGSFRGEFRFSGEEGYAEIAAHAARGSAEQDFRRICKVRPHPGAGSLEAGHGRARRPNLTLIGAVGKSATGATVAFEALGVDGEDSHGRPKAEPGALVVAALNERREAVAIERSTLLFGAGAGVLLSDPEVQPVTATVALPAPFAGTASLLKEGDSPATWSGDLSVSLPGAMGVALTGPEFKAAFCRASGEDQLKRCLAPFAEAEGQLSSAAPIPSLSARPGSPG